MNKSIDDKVATETEIISDLKRSALVVGRLYPVLVDKNGIVIDGLHRLKADPSWFKVKVPFVESEEQRLLARLITNICRRNVPSEEKTEMLNELGQIYLEQGVPRRELIRKLVEKTGLSYRWVMKYASNELKLRPGLGGPRRGKQGPEFAVARRATPEDNLFLEHSERVVKLVSYSNTSFATMLVEKRFFLRLKQAANDLGVDVDVIINNALLITFQKINQIALRTTGSTLFCAAK